MRVPFRPYPGRPHLHLYPLIRVSIGRKHAQRTRPFEAMVDSGAAECMFHASIAVAIGIKLESGRKEQRTGISGARGDVWVHPVQLYIGLDLFSIEAAFSPALPLAGLLGRSGFFEHYRVTFDPAPDPPELEIERVYRA
jgi:hypothetical protein